MSKTSVYLDNAATTPVASEKMKPYFQEKYGNPSSSHDLGRQAQEAIKEARQNVADFLSCLADEIIFTGSATESNNLAIRGVVEKYFNQHGKAHVITSAIEHSSVLEVCKDLQRKKIADITYLKVSKEGLVDLTELKKEIKKNTALISLGYANNEIGTIQSIAKTGQLVEEVRGENLYPLLHTDAVQAAGYLNCSVNELGVDLLTFNGHKIYGPKGVGILFLREGLLIDNLIQGGGQEKNRRSGTENVPAIVGLGQAVKMIKEEKKIQELRDQLKEGILKNISETQLNGSDKDRLPNNVNVCFSGAEGESIVFALAEKGIYTSTASACASHSLKPSHVLLAIGKKPMEAHSSIRFSLGRQTTEEDVKYVLEVLPLAIERLRKISGGIQ